MFVTAGCLRSNDYLRDVSGKEDRPVACWVVGTSDEALLIVLRIFNEDVGGAARAGEDWSSFDRS